MGFQVSYICGLGGLEEDQHSSIVEQSYPSSHQVHLMKLIRIFLVLLWILTLAGCAGTKEMFGIAPDAKGQFFMGPSDRDSNGVTVYVYRPKGYAYQPDVFINGTNRSLLAPGAFLQATERPGKVQIVVQANKDIGNWNFKPIGTTFDAKAGERRYFRISAGLS